MSSQGNSDPLPYVQVDRAVHPRVHQLAGAIGVSPQHALGSLVGFWELCGDPRELEALVRAGKTEVVLPSEHVERKFRLASGHHLPAIDLEALGLVELRDDGCRVRGMSRYLAPIRKRVAAQTNASAGGKASVLARISATGTAKPSGRKGQPTSEAGQKQIRTDERTDERSEHEPTANPSVQRTAYSVHRQKSFAGEQQPAPLELSLVEQKAAPDPTWQPLVDALSLAFQQARGETYRWSDPDFAALKRLRKGNADDVIAARWARGLRGSYSREVNSVAQLASGTKWNALATDDPTRRGAPSVATAGIGEHRSDEGEAF